MLLYTIYYRGNSVDTAAPLRDPTPHAMLAQCANGDNSWLVNRAGEWQPIDCDAARMMLARNLGGDPIRSYTVRRRGQSAWCDGVTLATARRECRRANRDVQPGHLIFAEHASGDTSGPYA